MKSLAGNPAEGKKPETNKNKDSEEVEGENTDEGLVKEEEKEVGVVKLHVYKSYWLAIGHCLATSILLSLFLMQGNVTIFNGGKNNFQWSVERIWECIVYILLCPVISLENSHHFLNQSDAELKNHWWLGRPRFPALLALFLPWVLIGSSKYFPFFGLAIVITLVLVLQQLIETRFTCIPTLFLKETEIRWKTEAHWYSFLASLAYLLCSVQQLIT